MAIDKLDLGITNTEELDPTSAADAFLSDTPLEKLEEIKKKKSKPAASTTKVKKKVDEDEEEDEEEDDEEELDEDSAANAFLGNPEDEEEEEEEDEEEENPLLLKKKQAEKKEKPEEQEEGGQSAETTETNEFEVMSNQLFQLGVFTQDEEDEEFVPARTAEEFAERFQQEKQKGATQWLDAFLRKNGEDRMDLFEAIFINNMDPREYLPAYNQVMDLEEMNLEEEVNQEKVFREFYHRQGFSPEKIETKLQKAKDYGDLADDAQEMHQRLLEDDRKALEEKQAAKEREEQVRQQTEQVYKNSVTKILIESLKAKELKGLPITEKKAKEAADFLTTPKYRTPSGELLTEFDKFVLESKKPENVEMRAIIALLHLNNWDFSKIEKKAISKETNQLFSGLKKTTVKSKTTKVNQPDPWANL